MVPALVVLAIGAAIVLWLRSQRRAFVVVVTNGEVTVRSGWMPGAMLSDFRAALKSVPSGKVVGHFEEGGLRVVASGAIDEFVEQRLRNIARLYPIGSFRASRAPEAEAAKTTGFFAFLTLLFSRRD